MSMVIQYLFDPLCGWCYGAAPGVSALINTSNVTIELLPTGLFSGRGARAMNAEFASYAWSNDLRIGQLSGQIFSDRYKQSVLGNVNQRFDSGPATLALTAARQIDPRLELAALKSIQRARYVDGKDVTNIEVLAELLEELDLDGAATALRENGVALQHANAARLTEAEKLMQQFSVRGVPNFIGVKEGKRKLLNAQVIYTKPRALLDEIEAI